MTYSFEPPGPQRDIIFYFSTATNFWKAKKTIAPRGTDRSPEYNEHFYYKLDSRVKNLNMEWNQKQQHFVTQYEKDVKKRVKNLTSEWNQE